MARTTTAMLTYYLSLLYLLSGLLTTTQAQPLTTTTKTTPPHPRQEEAKAGAGLYTWQATDFSFGCGSAACGLGFNVSAPAGYAAEGSRAPAFDVQCGAQYGSGWVDCTANSGAAVTATTKRAEEEASSQVQVLWDTSAGTAPPYQIRVSHVWFDEAAGARWNATGQGSSAGGEDGTEFEVRGQRLVGEVASE